MSKKNVVGFKKEIMEIGKLLWDKDLASGLNGNISVRVDAQTLLLTGHATCLGRLTQDDILLLDLEGNVLEGGRASTEKLLHTQVYKNFGGIQAVIHTHLTYANGYFNVNDRLTSATFESRLFLGDIQAIVQKTPAVTDIHPVLQALENNNIVMLKNHGALSIGKSLFDCFLLLQCLEDAVKMDVVSRLYSSKENSSQMGRKQRVFSKSAPSKKFRMFSKEHMDEIVRFVNADETLRQLGQDADMTMELAVKLDETGDVYSFSFEKGKITGVGQDENVEFLVSASEKVWREVFNRQIDPFVATTQRKMNLRGDFAKISKWYAPCSRLFELWSQVSVE